MKKRRLVKLEDVLKRYNLKWADEIEKLWHRVGERIWIEGREYELKKRSVGRKPVFYLYNLTDESYGSSLYFTGNHLAIIDLRLGKRETNKQFYVVDLEAMEAVRLDDVLGDPGVREVIRRFIDTKPQT